MAREVRKVRGRRNYDWRLESLGRGGGRFVAGIEQGDDDSRQEFGGGWRLFELFVCWKMIDLIEWVYFGAVFWYMQTSKSRCSIVCGCTF